MKDLFMRKVLLLTFIILQASWAQASGIVSGQKVDLFYRLASGRNFICKDANRQVVLGGYFAVSPHSRTELKLASSAFGDENGDVELGRLEIDKEILLELTPATGEVFFSRIVVSGRFTGVLQCSEGMAAVYSRRDFQGGPKFTSPVACCLQ